MNSLKSTYNEITEYLKSTQNKIKKCLKSKYIRFGCYVGFGVIALWIGSLCFSDDGGNLDALFSGLAFAGLIITLWMQRDNLKLQRKDLNIQSKILQQTTDELAGQKKQFELQNKTLKLQQFESTFFQLLNQVNSVSENMRYTTQLREYTCSGEEMFKRLYGSLKEDIEYIYSTDGTVAIDDDGIHITREQNKVPTEIDREIYKTFYRQHSFLGLYFRSLYRLIKYVDGVDDISNVDLTDDEKYQYTSFVRAQLSDNILLLLFYNCVLGIGEDKFKPLVQTYALLKNMPKDRVVHEVHLDWIDKTAFGPKKRNKSRRKLNK